MHIIFIYLLINTQYRVLKVANNRGKTIYIKAKPDFVYHEFSIGINISFNVMYSFSFSSRNYDI